MKYAALVALFSLAACGADGAPDRPTAGVSVSGEAQIGVTNTPAAE